MTQINFDITRKPIDFRKSLSKGEIGELFFKEYLENQGWSLLMPATLNRPHFCDIFATKNKRDFICADVKTKARLNKINATGIDIYSYESYIDFSKQKSIPFYLVFVNDKDGDVHCANIRYLENSGTGFFLGQSKKIICWPINVMRKIFTLTPEQIALLSTYDQRNYVYEPV